MREEIVEKRTYTKVTCDFCGGSNKGYSAKQCNICERDVCTYCAVVTDDESLKPDQFWGDYPDYYCKQCWHNGEEEVRKILELRDTLEKEEDKLFGMWKTKCGKYSSNGRAAAF